MIKELIENEEAATLAEYALLVSLVALAAIGMTQMFGNALKKFYKRITRYRSGMLGMGP
jgi:Flp pilus assembly pilin Flp